MKPNLNICIVSRAGRFLMLFLISILISFSFRSKAGVSDTIHVERYTIYIDTINYTTHSIRASCEISIKSRMNSVNNISLSLLQLNIDSIVGNNGSLTYLYNDTVISITPPAPLMLNDTISLRIYYNGQPKQDPTGWGGFYFSGTYAFNLGAGFGTNPHNLGRIWFPCIDEFDDKSLYDFYVTTPPSYKAFCNGLLMSWVTHPNLSTTWYWKMNQPIASYMAGVAVSTYYTLQRNYNSLPVEWASAASDTNKILSTFQHIDTVLSSYISAYGAYPFDKVGFILVPFNSGAMEHATSIHIGQPFINGSLTYETLWAHELSHMWWGDKVTCKNEKEMWLNEGFASYNESFITEKIYGRQAYKDRIRTNHRKVVQFSHIIDGNYYSLDQIPHDYTYGSTVYDKGADIVHTLRNFMGDNNFFNGCRQYMTNHAYGNATSNDLRDDLASASGISMTRFFDDWISTPGFPHFSIDSVVYIPGGLDHYFVYVRQRSKGNNHIYSMPVEINFTNGIIDTTLTVLIDSATQMFHCAIVMNAEMITLDRNEKISDATTDFERWVKTVANITLPETNFVLNVQTLGPDSSLIRVEHNWVKPDGWKQSNPGIRLSDYHYWKVDGIFEPGFTAKGSFIYNGSANTTSGYIDNNLITGTEDSIVILYRASVADDWSQVNGFTRLISGNAFDKVGTIRVDTLKKGEYVLGYLDPTVDISNETKDEYLLIAYPNPSADTFHITFNLGQAGKAQLIITDSAGRIIEKSRVNSKNSNYTWYAGKYPAGIYIAELFINNVPVKQARLLLSK